MSTIATKVVDSDKSKPHPLNPCRHHCQSQLTPCSVWATLITNDSYLPGLLTLEFSLRRVESKYPLVALHTGSLPPKTLHALTARGIPTQQVPYLLPGPPSPPSPPPSPPDSQASSPISASHPTLTGTTTTTTTTNGGGNDKESGWYANDPRFRACFTKLAVFSLTGYARIVLLDADMLVRRNMDELFDLPLAAPAPSHSSPPSSNNNNMEESPGPIFAATHACLCNPLHFAHYPPSWTPSNCAFTAQHPDPDRAQTTAAAPSSGLGLLNGGLLCVTPSARAYAQILAFLSDPRRATPASLPFADQSLLSIVFEGRWAALPYVYNALKTMRWEQVHGRIWRDGEVKCVHYILTPKPWEVKGGTQQRGGQGGAKGGDVMDGWWWGVDGERKRWEEERGIAG